MLSSNNPVSPASMGPASVDAPNDSPQSDEPDEHHRLSYPVPPAYLPANLWDANSPTYSQIISDSLPSEADQDIMKRPLDSSVPISPMNSVQSLLDNSGMNDSFAQKKPRYDGIHPGAAPMGYDPASAGMDSRTYPAALHSVSLQNQGGQGFGNGHGSVGSPGGQGQGQFGMQMGGMNMGFGMGFPLAMNMNYSGGPIISPSMNPNTMTGNYGPAAAAAAAAAAGNATGRTVYVGNLPSEASVDELLNLVRFGPIEAVRLLPEKSCVFISFLDGSTAAAFHADACVKKLALHGQELKIGWGKPSIVHPSVSNAVATAQATRNVFVGNLDPEMNEQDLRNDLGQFGPIDQVKIVRDKNIGFVHFLSIATAIKVVSNLPSEPGWEGKRVNYGKDRCAYVPKAQQDAVRQAQTQAMNAIAAQHQQATGSPFSPFSPMSAGFSGGFPTPDIPNSAGIFPSPAFLGNGYSPVAPGFGGDSAANQQGNRTIYLGNIHPDITVEELCNHIRGGMLQQIRYFPEKHNAFVTFVNPLSALTFYQSAQTTGLALLQRRLRVGWGKHSGSISPALLQAIQAGASRNVYIGQIADFNLFTEEKLRADFGEFGDIDMINFLTDKGVAFVNFTSISSAQKAIEGIKLKPEYSILRISYGKDRCANPPRNNMRSMVPAKDAEPMQATNPITDPDIYDDEAGAVYE
ncbi:uncharacterized protein L203_101786 [Cryptococcus depauperatus CBS 7841]|uniref:Uncharacterized protein n=1 Tax=Cryptococcus depauperatus CBS 7841 TaxID=1295531 RepID=A0A1E3IGU5_9TREE|nr:cytoplasmic protein [Cryptococcus depauperatus CBS 7841]